MRTIASPITGFGTDSLLVGENKRRKKRTKINCKEYITKSINKVTVRGKIKLNYAFLFV